MFLLQGQSAISMNWNIVAPGGHVVFVGSFHEDASQRKNDTFTEEPTRVPCRAVRLPCKNALLW